MSNTLPVRIWEEPVTIPTYVPRPENPNPVFYRPQMYQFASRYVYPYALNDNLSDEKRDVTYRALYLENEYIKLCVIPQLGGKLFYATDKTNDYEIFYRQHVVKPSNIGMLGAWTSGGVEWCPFHHHRMTTMVPSDYVLVENDDGSKTIWVGEIERLQRMKWLVGTTLHPGSSLIENEVKLINRTDLPFSMLYWANAAVHVNDHYQVLFPPGARIAAFHRKLDFAHWPVTKEPYINLPEYADNLDVSWWKNNPHANSFFVHDLAEDFMAGYDHGREAGTCHVADRRVFPGAKVFVWGTGAEGQMWDRVLTDDDGPYAELMVGAFSDNQPDYSWIKPFEVKHVKHHWFPLRRLGGLRYANTLAAANLHVRRATAHVAFNTTSKHTGALVTVTVRDETVFDRVVDIGPASPFTAEVPLPPGTPETDVRVGLRSENGRVLISYQPSPPMPEPELPPVVPDPPPPEEIETVEQLYLTGLRIRQFHDPRFRAREYFEEALRRDAGDSRCNVEVAIDFRKRGDYDRAETHLRRAIDRIGGHYTRPRDCEAYFHLGAVLAAQDRNDEARDSFSRAAWDRTWYAAAQCCLAKLSCREGALDRALCEAERSLRADPPNPGARALHCRLLRRMGRLDEADAAAREMQAFDPLDFGARNEQRLIAAARGDATETLRNELADLMRDEPESYLELACEYINIGSWDDAEAVLQETLERPCERLRLHPTIRYCLGWLALKKGSAERADVLFEEASALPADFCFPSRLETMAILNEVLARNPRDPRARYYLGNLLYERQPLRAIEEWERAVKLDDNLAVAHRNLGWGYAENGGDAAHAIACYERAIERDCNQAIYLAELDMLHDRAGTPAEQRLALFEQRPGTALERYDAAARYAMALNAAGRFEDAMGILQTRFFPVTEEDYGLHEVYVDTCLLRGLELHDAGNAEQALEHFLRADEYPVSLQIGRRPVYPRQSQIDFHIGLGSEATKEPDRARASFAAAATAPHDSEYLYEAALAARKLGDTERAEKMLARLEEFGRQRLAKSERGRYTTVDEYHNAGRNDSAGGHYALGLAAMARGDRTNARRALAQALRADPGHAWTKRRLGETGE